MTQMNRSKTILLTAIAAVPLLVGTVIGQYQVGNDGRALDANNRLGSGGYNDNPQGRPQVTPNDIVYGNVTGGREFHGGTESTDPRAFRGATAGTTSDNFVRGSSGSPQPNAAPADLTVARPFYGMSRAVPPPPGYVREGYSGGYVAVAPKTQRGAEDQRLGTPLSSPQIVLPQPGELVLPGPVDPSGNAQTIYSASPLYGIKQLHTDQAADQYFLNNYTNLRPDGSTSGLQISNTDINRMREELKKNIVTEEGLANENNLAQPLNTPMEAPVNQPLPGQSLAMGVQNNPVEGGLSTDQGVRNKLIAAPAAQSSQYAELQQRLDRYKKQAKTDEEANREFQAQVRAAEEAKKNAGTPGLSQPGVSNEQPAPGSPDYVQKSRDRVKELTKPAATRTPGTGAPQFERSTTKPAVEEPAVAPEFKLRTPAQPKAVAPQAKMAKPVEPLKVSSLADGVQASGLRQLLLRAEELMKQGKYVSAIDHYEAAQSVAPNNPLIVLGCANAELAAGYYSRAQAHLEQAFVTDPALLMGQYDLRKFFGEERLQYLVKDLKSVTQTEQDQGRALFLLAYIAYNTGNEARAADYLSLAEKHGAPVNVTKMLREYWYLPKASQ